ncbi:MAG: flagellar type III secretion system protein FlhB [Pseudomonadota bacterium]
MSDNQSSQEKSHEPSQRKLEQSRKKGELPRSQDAQTAAAYIGFAAAMFLVGGWSAVFIGETLMAFLARPGDLVDLFHSPAASSMAWQVSGRIFGGIAPVLAMPVALILVLLISQRAVVVAPSKLMPKLSRISPIQNAKQKYGPHGLMEFLKAAIKLTAVAVVLGVAVLSEIDLLAGYARIDPRLLPALLDRQFWNVATGVLILAVSIAFIDLVWQRAQHMKKMRMTHQEVKDEQKSSEGDPHIRQSRRERARAIANNRMLLDVPTADVVITNPTHYAVALKWDRAAQSVPVCVAKGVDEIAQTIRQKAEQAGVPIHEDAPTARSVHALVKIGHPIQPDHYKAVAAAIVFADEIRKKGTGAAPHRRDDGRMRARSTSAAHGVATP